jgi:hypothetical protein
MKTIHKTIMRSVILFTISAIQGIPLKEVFTIRNIIGSKAVLSTVINEVNNEIMNENALISQMTSLNHNIKLDIFNAFVFSAVVYAQYRYFIYFEKKLSGVEMFSNIQGKTRTVLFIFMLVFTKNIQNAI